MMILHIITLLFACTVLGKVETLETTTENRLNNTGPLVGSVGGNNRLFRRLAEIHKHLIQLNVEPKFQEFIYSSLPISPPVDLDSLETLKDEPGLFIYLKRPSIFKKFMRRIFSNKAKLEEVIEYIIVMDRDVQAQTFLYGKARIRDLSTYLATSIELLKQDWDGKPICLFQEGHAVRQKYKNI